MPKRYRCEGITKRGKRCRNRVRGLRCYLHREPEDKQSVLQTIGKGVAITSGTITAVKFAHEIIKFLILHWPEINRFFHGLDTRSYYDYWLTYKAECRRAINHPRATEQEGHDLVIEFNTWFPTLPRDVQKMLVTKFGERRINTVRREGTS